MRVCNFCLSPKNGYLNEWRPVQSVIARVINKLKLEKIGIIQLRLQVELKETKLTVNHLYQTEFAVERDSVKTVLFGNTTWKYKLGIFRHKRKPIQVHGTRIFCKEHFVCLDALSACIPI